MPRCQRYCAAATQALSKRIHYGKFVAEAKFQSQTARYTELIQRGDVEGIMDALTDRAVELKVPPPCCCVTRWMPLSRAILTTYALGRHLMRAVRRHITASSKCCYWSDSNLPDFPQVLLQVVDRVRSKAATYGQDFSAPQQSHDQQQNGASNGTSGQRRLKVAPDTIAMLYDKWVMPMTKQVQVRHAHENDGKHGGDSGSCCPNCRCVSRKGRYLRSVITHLQHTLLVSVAGAISAQAAGRVMARELA